MSSHSLTGAVASAPSPAASDHQLKRAKKASLAAFLGGALEYYDFFIYATAASLIFSRIFFPEGDPTVALIQSFAIFGVGYVFRPLGAFVFGHLGDKIGRKNTLVMTLVLMGGATFLIGVLPDFSTAGYWAPVLLVLMRVLQGLSGLIASEGVAGF
ncbi:MFS transporter [Kocuria carniphila]|uniref:MFS transporter n=1 Tax=Kocuria carniphila TaxID=262208 RepID=UPI003F68A560